MEGFLMPLSDDFFQKSRRMVDEIRRGSFLENAPLIFKACASFGGGAQAVNCAISAPTLAT